MSQAQELKLTYLPREATGKGGCRKTRAKGLLPGVVYGPKLKEPVLVNFNPAELRSVFKAAGHSSLVTLQAGEGAAPALNGTKILIKEVQVNRLRNEPKHVDLHQLDMSKKIRVTVPLRFTGKAKGLADGGLMSYVLRTVEIKCAAGDIPHDIEVDVSALELNDSLKLSQIAAKFEASGKLEFLYESDSAVVAVVPPEEEKVAEPVAAAAGAEGAAAGAAPAAGAPAAAGAAPAKDAKAAAPAKDAKK